MTFDVDPRQILKNDSRRQLIEDICETGASLADHLCSAFND